jgi:3'-5' exonuclease
MAELQSPAAFFVDIETVPGYPSFDDVPKGIADLYVSKFKWQIEEMVDTIDADSPKTFSEQAKKHYESHAALYAEFCQIVSISVSKIVKIEGQMQLWVKTVTGRNEKELLLYFCAKLINNAQLLCAHNGKEFDFNILFRKLIINRIKVPDILNPTGKKPYEMRLEDTMEMWGGVQWKYKVSLDCLAQIFGFESPKLEMSGADVAPLFYSYLQKQELPWDYEDQLKKIAKYNSYDTAVLARIYCVLKQLDITITEVIVDEKVYE